jgi:hypothetical protein
MQTRKKSAGFGEWIFRTEFNGNRRKRMLVKIIGE